MDPIRIGAPGQMPAGPVPAAKDGNGTEFSKVIKSAIDRVENAERTAERSVAELLNGKADVHEAMIDIQKADLSMRMLLTVRDKVVEAYKEIMHMQF